MNKKNFYLSLLLIVPSINTFALEQNYCAQSINLPDSSLQTYVGALCQAGASMQAVLKNYEPANPNNSNASHLAFGNPAAAITAPAPMPAAAQPTPTVQNTPPPTTPASTTSTNSGNIYSNS